MNTALCCAKCGEVVLKSMDGDSAKLRAKVIVFKDDAAFAICKGCGTELPVPISIDNSKLSTMTKSLRLYVNK